MNVLEIHGLSKRFGKQTIIDGLDMTVPEGCVFGFIGKNGSGKTTTMKMVLGLLAPDAGDIRICGENVRFGHAPAGGTVGYLPDVPEFYAYMTAMQYLRLCGAIIGLSPTSLQQRAEALLDLVGLAGEGKRIGGYSRGMKQRLGIAQALLTEPKLLICDEPTSALDPAGRKDILDILRTISDQTTVIFSTHILSDVERICDRVALLNDGKIAVSGTLSALKGRHGRDSLRVAFANAEDLARFKAQPSVQPLLAQAEEAGCTWTLHSRHMALAERTLFSVFAETGICPLQLEVVAPSLEHLFLEVTQ